MQDKEIDVNLRSYLQHAIAHVPYYRAIWENSSPSSLDLIKWFQTLPTMTKITVATKFSSLVSIEHLKLHPPKLTSTSGTTYKPTIVLYSPKVRRSLEDEFYLNMIPKWLYQDTHEVRILFLGGQNARKIEKTSASDDKMLPYSVTVFSGSWLSIQMEPESIYTLQPHIIVAEPYQLLQMLDVLKGRLPKSLQALVSSYDLLDDASRNHLEAYCPVHECYVSSEVSPVIAWTFSSQAVLTVNPADVLVEVVDENDNCCAPGQIGRIVITDLSNHLMPLMRYDLGDLACVRSRYRLDGRWYCTEIDRLEGRTDHALHLSDKTFLTPRQILSILNKRIDEVALVVSDNDVKVLHTGSLDGARIKSLEAKLASSYTLSLVQVARISPQSNGKFGFLSRILE